MSYRTVERGTVKYFNFTKKFGFIIPDNGDDDIFVHYSDICGEYPNKRLFKGDAVEFATIDDERGKKKAIEVKKLETSENDIVAYTDEMPAYLDDTNQSATTEEPPFVDLLAEKNAMVDLSNVADQLVTVDAKLGASSFYTLKFKYFKAVSERTGNSFTGNIEVIYEPATKVLEQSAFANYLASFKGLEVNDEQVVALIYHHLKDRLAADALEVTGTFKLNKQLETTVTVGNIQS